MSTRPAWTTLRREHLPALADFARGYLHEDVIAEYGLVPRAVAAFRAEASEAEGQALARDLARLAADAREWSLAHLQAFVTHELRSAWRPASLDDSGALVSAAEGDR